MKKFYKFRKSEKRLTSFDKVQQIWKMEKVKIGQSLAMI